MQRAGGIIGLVAGVFSVFAAIATLCFGGFATAVEVEGAKTVVGLGWGGVLFSFLCIVFSAVSLGSQSKVPGALLTLSAIAGAILGGTLVAVFMALAFLGGLLATVGTKTKPQQQQA